MPEIESAQAPRNTIRENTRLGKELVRKIHAVLVTPRTPGDAASIVEAVTKAAKELDALVRVKTPAEATLVEKVMFDDMKHDVSNVVYPLGLICGGRENELTKEQMADVITGADFRNSVARSIDHALLPEAPVRMGVAQAAERIKAVFCEKFSEPLPCVDALDEMEGTVTFSPAYLAAIAKEFVRNYGKYGKDGSASLVLSTEGKHLTATFTNLIRKEGTANVSNTKRGAELAVQYAQFMGAETSLRGDGRRWTAEIRFPIVAG